MSDFPRTPQNMKREVSAEGGALWRTLYHLWPYMWPSDRSDLKARVVMALGLLLVAKLATIAVPFTFKWATDSLVDDPARPAWGWVLAVPLTMTAAYGGMRIVMALLTQARDGLFAKVAMNAVRRLAVMTFEHMHRLSLRFHLERKTGGLTRVLERGRNAIETIVRMVILQLIPTIVEVALICVVLLYQFDWRYVLVIFVTVTLYIWYTYLATEWRIGIRRKMNESDTDANTKAIDSLLNYETVKYFSAEERETQRYDRSMERYEHASVQAYVSLAVLNAGQATIFTIGLTADDGAHRLRHQVRHPVDRRLRHDQRHDDPALPAAQFHGHGLSRDQAGGDRHRADVHAPRPRVRDQGSPRRAGARRHQGHDPLRGRALRLRAGAADPARHLLRGSGRAHGRDRRAVGRRQVDDLAPAVPLLRGDRRPHHHRRPGHPRRHPDLAAQRHRHGSAGHRAVQRHRALQHPLRPLGRDRRRGRGGGEARPDRRLHPLHPEGLRHRGRRARPQALRRREAARRHRPHDPQRPADPGARRGDLGARQPHREGHPGRARPRSRRTAPPSSSPTACRP